MKRLLKWFIATMLLLAGGYFVALGVSTYQRDAMVAELRDVYASTSRSRAAGVVASNDGPRVDRARESGLAFDSVFEEYAAYRKNNPELKSLMEVLRRERPSDWSPETLEQLDALFEARSDLLERLKSAVAGGGPLRVYDPSERLTASLPHVSYAWELGHLLAARAHAAMGCGEVDAAVDDLLAALGLGELLAPEPVTLSQAVRMDLAARVADAFATWVGTNPFSDRQLAVVIERFAQAGHREGIASSMAGEAMAADERWPEFPALLRATRNERGMVANAFVSVYCSRVGQPLVNLDRNASAQSFLRLAELSRVPYYEAFPALQSVPMDEDFPVLYPYSRNWAFINENLLVEQAEHEALMDLTMLGIVIESNRADTGVCPASLSDVEPMLPNELPLDPFTGNSYVYHLTSDSFLLYSLGRNRRDDGGTHDRREGDIVWRGASSETGGS